MCVNSRAEDEEQGTQSAAVERTQRFMSLGVAGIRGKTNQQIGGTGMNRLFVPTSGPGDWRRLLADPARQWVKGRSALELAVAWEGARKTDRGLPSAIEQLMDSHPSFAGAVLLLGIPEHQVQFDGGGHASQNDLWALLRAPVRLVSLAVEGKAGEGFDRTVADWLANAKPASGKPARLQQLRQLLGLTEEIPGSIRYQLLHRTGSAIREAVRFGASTALLLVQSFASDPQSVRAFEAFCDLLGCSGRPPALIEGPQLKGVRLYLGWVVCAPSTPEQVASAI